MIAITSIISWFLIFNMSPGQSRPGRTLPLLPLPPYQPWFGRGPPFTKRASTKRRTRKWRSLESWTMASCLRGRGTESSWKLIRNMTCPLFLRTRLPQDSIWEMERRHDKHLFNCGLSRYIRCHTMIFLGHERRVVPRTFYVKVKLKWVFWSIITCILWAKTTFGLCHVLGNKKE